LLRTKKKIIKAWLKIVKFQSGQIINWWYFSLPNYCSFPLYSI